MSNDLVNRVRQTAAQLGFSEEKTKGGHFRFTLGSHCVHAPSTSRAFRAAKNRIADLRRIHRIYHSQESIMPIETLPIVSDEARSLLKRVAETGERVIRTFTGGQVRYYLGTVTAANNISKNLSEQLIKEGLLIVNQMEGDRADRTFYVPASEQAALVPPVEQPDPEPPVEVDEPQPGTNLVNPTDIRVTYETENLLHALTAKELDLVLTAARQRLQDELTELEERSNLIRTTLNSIDAVTT